MFSLDSLLSRWPRLIKLRYSPNTIWAVSSMVICFDIFIYALSLPTQADIMQNTMHISESSNGLPTTLLSAGGIVTSIISGYISDRYCIRRPILLIAALGYSAAGAIFYNATEFYHILLYRLVNGLASGCACTLSYTSVGDVFDADILGFKVSVVLLLYNIGYTIAPVIGDHVYKSIGIHGVAAIVIGLGIFEFFVLIFPQDSLIIKKRLPKLIEANKKDEEKILTSSLSSSSLSTSLSPPASQAQENRDSKDIPVWKLIMRIPVAVPTIAIITYISLQCTLENLLPLHLDKAFNKSSDNLSLSFAMYGVALTVAVLPMGYIHDKFVLQRGENTRYYIMCLGAIVTIGCHMIIAFASTYAVLMVGYIGYAVTTVLMSVPAMSLYGDYINSLKINSMAQSYGLSSVAWFVGAIGFPAAGTSLYSKVGFRDTVLILSFIICPICIVSCLVFPVRNFIARRN